MLRNRPSALGVLVLAIAAVPSAAQNRLWIQQFGSAVEDRASAAASDGSGGAYVGGLTDGSLGGPSAGSYDSWLARYDELGNQLWLRQLGTSGTDEVWTIAPDNSGGLYSGGTTVGSLGGGSAGKTDAWLARFDGAGNQLWIRQVGTAAEDEIRASSSDGAGGVYASGHTTGDLGGPNVGGWDCWLTRYDSAGNQVWLVQLGTGMDDLVWGAAFDGYGGVFLCGETFGDLGGPSAGGRDIWLAHFNAAGNQIWCRQLGTSADDWSYSVATDSSGGVYICGRTQGSLGGPLLGVDDAWLARYDVGGNQVWIRQFGTSAGENVYAAAPDGASGVYLCGYTYGALGGPNAGDADAWLARYDSAGNQLWVDQPGTSASDCAYALAPASLGGVYICGHSVGNLGGQSAGSYDAWLARYEGWCTSPVGYCTAKANSLGCTPLIGWTGTPSLTGSNDDFHITASNVLNNKNGLLFWGTQDFGAPFQGGTLCVKPPIVRTDVQSSGGNPPPNDCSGAYDFHLSQAYMGASLFQVGTTVYAQYWSRDPGFSPPNNVGLTDALRVVVCP